MEDKLMFISSEYTEVLQTIINNLKTEPGKYVGAASGNVTDALGERSRGLLSKGLNST